MQPTSPLLQYLRYSKNRYTYLCTRLYRTVHSMVHLTTILYTYSVLQVHWYSTVYSTVQYFCLSILCSADSITIILEFLLVCCQQAGGILLVMATLSQKHFVIMKLLLINYEKVHIYLWKHLLQWFFVLFAVLLLFNYELCYDYYLPNWLRTFS